MALHQTPRGLGCNAFRLITPQRPVNGLLTSKISKWNYILFIASTVL